MPPFEVLEPWSEVTGWTGEIAYSLEHSTTDDTLGHTETTLSTRYRAAVDLSGTLAEWRGEGPCSGSWSERRFNTGAFADRASVIIEGIGSGLTSARLSISVDDTGAGFYHLEAGNLIIDVRIIQEITAGTGGSNPTVSTSTDYGGRTLIPPRLTGEPLSAGSLVLSGSRTINTPLGPATIFWALRPVIDAASRLCEVAILDDTGNRLVGPQTTNVGQRQRLTAAVARPAGAKITSLMWLIDRTAIRHYSQDPASASVTDLTLLGDLLSNPVEFYWIDGGAKNVQVFATIEGTLRCSANVSFQVNRPRVDSFAAQRRNDDLQIAIGIVIPRHGPELHFGDQITSGIVWDATVTTQSGGIGTLGFLQLASRDTRMTQADADGGGSFQVLAKLCLDRRDPPNSVMYGGLETPIPGGWTARHAANDSPSVRLQPSRSDGTPVNLVDVGVNDSYRVYLMYRPAGAASIWVSLARLDWGWCARATKIGDAWRLNGPFWSWDHPAVDTTELPVWSCRIQALTRNLEAGSPPTNCAARPPS
jgi:hypothetical protein